MAFSIDFVLHLKHAIQLFALISSLLFNSLLIYLVTNKSPKKMGTYKHLMCFFSSFSMLYAIIDWLVKPFIHSYGASFCMIMDLRDRRFLPPSIAFGLVASLAGCFGVTIYAIAIHFIFRYFALERKGRLKYFEGKRLLLWLTIPLLAGVAWFLFASLLMDPDPEFSQYLKEDLKEAYDVEVEWTVYTGAFFWRLDELGSLNLHWKNTTGFLALNALMAVPFLTIIVFGSKSYLKVKELLKQGECDYTKRLQMQLYKALVAQTLIPMMFLFLPIGILFTAPLLHVDISALNLLITFFYALYPAVDPLPIVFFIDEYRNFVLDIFRSSLPKSRVASSVATVESIEMN